MKEEGDKSESVHASCPGFGRFCMRQSSMEHTNKISRSKEVSSDRNNNIDAEHIISKIRRKATSKLLEHIKQIVLQNPIECLPLFKVELEKLIAAFTEYGIDPSPLKVKVDKLMMDIANYNSMQSACSGKIAPEVQHQRLADNKSHLDRAFNLQTAEKCHYESLLDFLASSENRSEKLKREQERLEERIDKLRVSISGSGLKIAEHKNAVDRLLKQKVEISKTPVLTSKDAKTLKNLKDSLEGQCKGFKDFTLR
ncbi:uncharacterized protein LOC121049372 [Rosa chinensis]|uniref:uncharacterized protein LOC121049372 n=1 Tax=Rosa chinensis TaxID=74649 RepID=UPI001AD915A0|nr:uncharacterized protein LOC121049372 [Rosa chinensis]